MRSRTARGGTRGEAKLVGMRARRGRTSSSPARVEIGVGAQKGPRITKVFSTSFSTGQCSVRQGSKTAKCTKREAMLLNCLEMVLRGDLKAMALLITLDEKSAIAHAAEEVIRITEG